MKVSTGRPRTRPRHPKDRGVRAQFLGRNNALTCGDAVVPQEVKLVSESTCTPGPRGFLCPVPRGGHRQFAAVLMFSLGRRLWAMGTPKPPPPRSGVENNIIEGAPDLAPAVVEDIATRTRRPPRSGPGSRSRLFARPPRARKRAHRSRWRRRSAAGCRRCWVSCAPPAPAHPAAPAPRRTSSTRPEWRMTPRWRGRVRPGHRHRGGSAWSGQLPARDREEAGDPVRCRPQAAESTSTHEQAADRDRRASSAPHRRGGPGPHAGPELSTRAGLRRAGLARRRWGARRRVPAVVRSQAGRALG